MTTKTKAGAQEMPWTRRRREYERSPLRGYDFGQEWTRSGKRRFSDHFEPMCKITMSGAEFVSLVRSVTPACSPGEIVDGTSGQGMTGVLTDFREPGSVRMVATDNFRLALKDSEIEVATGELPPNEGLFPARELREAARSASESGADSVEIAISEDGQVRFRVEDEVFFGKCVIAGYPNYRRVWPAGFAREISVGREALAETLRRLGPRARGQKEPCVDVTFAGDWMEVSVEDKRLKRGEARERLASEVKSGSDEEFSLSFNPTELLDGIEAVDAPEAIMSMNGPLDPVQIAPADEGGTTDYRYLIMPMRRPANEPTAGN